MFTFLIGQCKLYRAAFNCRVLIYYITLTKSCFKLVCPFVKCDKTVIEPLTQRYDQFQNSASLVFEIVDISLGKPRGNIHTYVSSASLGYVSDHIVARGVQ